MIDYSKFKTAEAVPEASSMIETFRAIGYSLESAVADIVDNSISASAKNIWIHFDWQGSQTCFLIKDDGNGMDNNELIQAMRPGSKNPLDDRSNKDLGSFGLGLKTASFSQCRKLTVISKKQNDETNFWTWDLDFVKEVRKLLPDVFLIAGNFDSPHAAMELENLGVDCGKFGIGVSQKCFTRQYTGIGTLISDLIKCKENTKRIN